MTVGGRRAARAADGKETLMTSSPSAELDVASLFAARRLGLVRMAVLLVDDVSCAEDVVQDAFIGLQRRAQRLRDPNAAMGYLRVSVLNNARSVLRRRRTVRHFLSRASVPEAVSPADRGLLVAEEHREVLAAVRTLPPRQQEVLILRYWSDLSEAEIAQTMGISEGTVKSTASRAMDKLEILLGATR